MRERVPLPEGQFVELVAAYATPPRAYHGFDHVEAVLAHFDSVAGGPGWHRPREVWLAVLYHDAIHVAGRSDNEARSAAFALDAIARWLPHEQLDAARIAHLIGLTARHGQVAAAGLGDGPDAIDAMHFLDCDMAILGAAPADFDAYDRGIAEEYRGRVPALMFRRGRRKFLAALLASERIYLSDWFHARLDAQARENLRRVLGRR